MKEYGQYQTVASMDLSTLEEFANYTASTQPSVSEPPILDDDRYPGSFFRIPGLPKPGNTTWSLAK